MNLYQRVNEVFQEGMTLNDLIVRLRNDGGKADFEKSTIRQILSSQGKRVKRESLLDRIRDRHIVGMSIETICYILSAESPKIYSAMRRMGLDRPKHRHRMNETELLKDLLLLENSNTVR